MQIDDVETVRLNHLGLVAQILQKNELRKIALMQLKQILLNLNHLKKKLKPLQQLVEEKAGQVEIQKELDKRTLNKPINISIF